VPAPFRFDRTWQLDATVEAVWKALVNTDDYPRWWPWLDRFEAGPLEAGTVAHFRIRPPLPYTLAFVVEVTDVIECALVAGTVSGDVAGPARFELTSHDGGCAARLVWELEVQRPLLVRLERFARPAMLWGHDRVVAVGLRQFERRALA
jgi:uncharacterized protein YndB with AHSA1/START domain